MCVLLSYTTNNLKCLFLSSFFFFRRAVDVAVEAVDEAVFHGVMCDHLPTPETFLRPQPFCHHRVKIFFALLYHLYHVHSPIV